MEKFKFYKDHDALQVKDIQRSKAFYMDVFGLEEIYNAGLGNDFVWLKLNDFVQIHLIKTEDHIIKHKGVHLAISTNDLEGFMEFLLSIDVPFENWSGDKNTTNTRPDGIKQIYLTDPDGYWIEINNNRLH